MIGFAAETGAWRRRVLRGVAGIRMDRRIAWRGLAVMVCAALLAVTWSAAPAMAQADESSGAAVAASGGAASGAGASGGGASGGGERTTFAEAFFVQRNPRTGRMEWLGSILIWFLIGLSVASLGLMGALSRANKKERIAPPGLVSESRRMIRSHGPEAVVSRLEREESFFAAIAGAALGEAEHGRDAMDRALDRASDEQLAARMRRVETLNILGAVSPMIGLFGTVYGMILAFREVVAAGGSPDPVGLAAGIGTALVTTFWGLVVAIPALAAYAIIRNRLDGLSAEASLAAEELIEYAAEARKAAPHAPAPRVTPAGAAAASS